MDRVQGWIESRTGPDASTSVRPSGAGPSRAVSPWGCREGDRTDMNETTDTVPERGRVHSIETFGTVDGPGIRYVVFFQGCPLRCLYCHNRDTWDRAGGRLVTVQELLADIEPYRPFLESSGGGVTATGGEPLLQARFVAQLFGELKSRGIKTALDTSGYTEITPAVDELLSYTDLVLLDIKHMDDAAHRRLTGVSNRRTLAFARHLAERGVPAWIRHVVVKGFTENTESASALASFVRTLPNVEKVELLPYHAMGKYKWEAVGAAYELENVEPPSPETITALKALFEEKDIPVSYAA